MVTVIFCIIFMLIGYTLGRAETNKKWIEKQPIQTPGCSAPEKDEPIIERLRKGQI